MPQSLITITSAEIIDLRVPTSDQMLGSDPFHKAPDYSSAVLHLETNSDLRGVSVVFTIGAGTDWMCHGIRDLCQLVVGTQLDEFTAAPFQLYRRLIDHHQLRWLHDGVFRMAAGAVLNAMWISGPNPSINRSGNCSWIWNRNLLPTASTGATLRCPHSRGSYRPPASAPRRGAPTRSRHGHARPQGLLHRRLAGPER